MTKEKIKEITNKYREQINNNPYAMPKVTVVKPDGSESKMSKALAELFVNSVDNDGAYIKN